MRFRCRFGKVQSAKCRKKSVSLRDDSCFNLHLGAPRGRDKGLWAPHLQRPLSKLSVVRLPDRYKFADAACIARQAQGRSDASCDFKWYARIDISEGKCHGRRKHLKSSIRTPRSAGKFISVGGFFLWFVSFFSGKERNEHGAPKARHPAQRDKSDSVIPRSGINKWRHSAQRDKQMSHYRSAITKNNLKNFIFFAFIFFAVKYYTAE